MQTIVSSREVRFNLTDKSKFNEEAVRKALKEKKFDEMKVKTAPPK